MMLPTVTEEREKLIQIQHRGSYSCNECGAKYVHRTSLYSHLSVHRNATKCPVCNVVLSRKYYLRQHLRIVHRLD